MLSITDSPTSALGLVKGNRLLMQGDKKFEYDARGNLVKETRGKDGKLKKTFHYNLQNQLIKVETNSAHETVTFKYDPLGRRIEKTDSFGTTQFLWVDNLLTQETRNNIKKTYIYEPGSFKPLAQVQATAWMPEVEQRREQLSDDKIYHYHLDHLGTPRELTNNEGKIVWKAKYKTYGNLAVKEIDEVENNLIFQGQYFDAETGLHYNRFRYYSPDTGQFINQDPIGLLGGLNNYQYAANPVGWIDPLGLTCKEDAIFKVAEDNAGPRLVDEIKADYAKSPLNSKLELHEFAALNMYTRKYYREMNGVLRGNKPKIADEWAPVISSTVSGLTTLSQVPNMAFVGTVYRGLDIDESKVHDLFTQGSEFSDTGFMSSSLNKDESFEGNVQITVNSKTGVKIQEVSSHGSEEEVLFKTAMKFDVVSKTKDASGVWHIELDERPS